MMERAYCLSCRNEIVTESGHVCEKCAKGQVGVTRKTGCRMKFSRKGLVCGSACGLVAGLLVAWLLTGCTTADQKRIQDELDRLNNTTTVTLPTTTTTTLPDGPNEGENFVPPSSGVNEVQANLWKPKADTRGGAAALFAAKWAVNGCTMNGEKHVESVGRTNGERCTFFMGKVGSAYRAPGTMSGWRGSTKVVELKIANPAQRTTLATGWQRFKAFFGADVGIEYVEVGI